MNGVRFARALIFIIGSYFKGKLTARGLSRHCLLARFEASLWS